MLTRFGQPLTAWGNESQRQVYALTVAFKSKTSVIEPRNIYSVHSAFLSSWSIAFISVILLFTTTLFPTPPLLFLSPQIWRRGRATRQKYSYEWLDLA